MENLKQKEFLELYEPVHLNLCRFCRAISGNLQDSEDLVNDSIVAAFSNMDKIKDKSAFKSYIFSIASNINKMRFRRKKFRAEFSEIELNQIIDKKTTPEQLTDFNLIYDKMMSLPAKYYEALILFYISDLAVNEIHKIQGGSLSAVKQHLKRGKEKLLNLLETPEQIKMAVLLFTL